MAGSLIGGLIKSGAANAANLVVFEPNSERASQLETDFGVSLAKDNHELIDNADVLVIAVKPQMLKKVLIPLAASMSNNRPLIVSIVAGIRIESIQKWLNGKFAIVRAMPNTPALVSCGATGLYANSLVSEKQKQIAENLLNAVGVSAWVANEQDIDSVTAISGSGPAYFMLFIQALIEAGVNAGLDPSTAKTLAVNTARGSAALIDSSSSELQTLIDNVTSPGGTTEKALQSFEADQFSAIVTRAFEAARLRGKQLGDELA